MPIPRSAFRFLMAPALAFLLAFPVPGRGQNPQEKLDTSLRQLEKEIAAARGLEFKSPVQGRIIPRQENDDKGKQGYYDPRAKTLFVFDDLAENYQKGVLIHEMAHALQDQHFDLGRLKATLHQDKFGSDADLALAALIEGDATLVMIEVLKKEQPKAAAMLDVPLEKAKNLQNAFLYAQGARYVKALKEKGGWASVNMAYRFPPRATAPILNLASVSTIDLGRGETLGAFALFQQLAKNPNTRAEALPLAQGWRGDRSIVEADNKTRVYACNDADHAAKLRLALVDVSLAGGAWKARADGETYADDKGHVLGVVARGARVYVYEAASAKVYPVLRDRFEGAPTLQIIEVKTAKTITFAAMIDRLLDVDFVCVGEYHDSEQHHRVQTQIIKALYAHDERLGVGMEMFQRPFQKALDRYAGGATKEDEFLKESEYQTRWGFDWSLYRPIVEFCRRNEIPMAALNARRELTRRVGQVGIEALNADEKQELGPIDIHVKAHRDHWYERLGTMHGPPTGKSSAEQKERGYQVMTVWDDYMARSAADFFAERRLRRMVILAGSGHIDRGFGIPNRAARYAKGRSMTVGIAIEGAGRGPAESHTDFLILVK